jgi:broad specificity phosphatase PhoE
MAARIIAVNTKKIRIFAQRHGERDGDSLMAHGMEQIKHSLELDCFVTAKFRAFYASPKLRTQQTAAIIAGNPSLVQISYGLYAPLTDNQIEAIWSTLSGRDATVRNWFEALPHHWGPRMHKLLLATLEEMAREVTSKNPGQHDLDIYACGHSLLLEMALPETEQNIEPLSTGDLIIFTFDLHDEALELIGSQIVRCDNRG